MLHVSPSAFARTQAGGPFGSNEQTSPDDVVFEHGGVTVVVDDVSLDLLNGAEVDFVEDLMGASFQIKNPNAASSCGCGNSFSI